MTRTLREQSYYEATARERVVALLDAKSFVEFVGPRERVMSPHLAQLGVPAAFDDGVVVGEGALEQRRVLIAAQEGAFIGGSVGEVHGAKIVGLLERAATRGADGVLLLLESGGVRLHEANAGLIAISEIIRALLSTRLAQVPVIALIGGANGCFGGMGIVACCCDRVIMSEEGRLALSGPEVIETVKGVEEFDSRDRALVWRTTGGKHRYLLGDADVLVADSIAQFRAAAIAALDHARPLTLDAVMVRHVKLTERRTRDGRFRDALDIWRAQGIEEPERLPLLEADQFLAVVAANRANNASS
ncbi:MAG TPA: biotin-independent malonate decarboxylase subunit beta [Casimicrobiaceae bacterium]|nr:biotin-independent malonate decarboxylase subunit beta [Casimicrobiaceae bacterium]